MTRTFVNLLILSVFFLVSSAADTFGQTRKYTDSFEKASLRDANLARNLETLSGSHSNLQESDLLERLDSWAQHSVSPDAVTRVVFLLKDDMIVMKVFLKQPIAARAAEEIESEAMKHSFQVANEVMSEWNKDRDFNLVRFSGVELRAIPIDARRIEGQTVETQSFEEVASPELAILVE